LWFERSCDNCSKILDSKYFPFKWVDLCVDCYEKINWRNLNSFRAKLNRNNLLYSAPQSYSYSQTNNSQKSVVSSNWRPDCLVCASCSSENILINFSWLKYCWKCGKTWDWKLKSSQEKIINKANCDNKNDINKIKIQHAIRKNIFIKMTYWNPNTIKQIKPTYIWTLSYKGHFYYWIKWVDTLWTELNFNYSKILEIL
jgi:hypothetical protein